MTTLTNSFEGGSNTTGITTGNSGGASGNAFDVINSSGAGSSLTFSSTHAAHGTLSMDMHMASGVSSGQDAAWTTSIGTQTEFWFRMYLFHTANPSVRTRIWQADISGSTLCGGLFLNTNGTLDMSATGGTAVITSTNSVPLSAWYRVEGFLIGNTSTGQISFSLYTTMDDATPLETKTSSAAQNTGGSPNSARYGCFAATTETPAFDLWIDDIGLSSTGALGPSFTVPDAKPLVKSIAVNRGAFYG